MPVRRTSGLKAEENHYLVTMGRAWAEGDTLTEALNRVKEECALTAEDVEHEPVTASLYLITPDTDAQIEAMTGAVHLEHPDAEHDHCTGTPKPVREEVRGKKVAVDGDGGKLEFLSEIEVELE